MRWAYWTGWLSVAASLGGCSSHPIPDDVSPFSTQQIVRFGRCEVRGAVIDYMVRRGMLPTNPPEPDASTISKYVTDIRAKEEKAIQQEKAARARGEDPKKLPKILNEKDEDFLRLIKVAVVYSFDFNITENNRAAAGVGLRLPGVTNVLDVGGTAAFDRTRIGSRVFGTEDKWDDLIANQSLCKKPWQRPSNAVYPLTGSIGVGSVVETFIDIDEQGGAKDNFVDTMTFTTSVGGDANAAIKLDPVPTQFRPVSGVASIGASRLDIHKLTVSLAFPQIVPKAITGVRRTDGDLNAPFERPPEWRARYNLCVQDARTRESSFKQLRLTDPVVYCIAYADEFAPQFGRPSAVKKRARKSNANNAVQGMNPPAPVTPAPPATIQQVRPNLRPLFQ